MLSYPFLTFSLQQDVSISLISFLICLILYVLTAMPQPQVKLFQIDCKPPLFWTSAPGVKKQQQHPAFTSDFLCGSNALHRWPSAFETSQHTSGPIGASNGHLSAHLMLLPHDSFTHFSSFSSPAVSHTL